MTDAVSAPMREIIAAAYRVFGNYRLQSRLTVCMCNVCVSVEDELALRTTPLKEVSERLLMQYTDSAHGYGGDEFLHFVPRYFELVAEGYEPSGAGLEVCFRRLGEAECRQQLKPEEAALADSFFERLHHDLRDKIDYGDWPIGRVAENILEYVVMVAIAGGDLERILRDWDRDERPTATLHLASVVRRIGFEHLHERAAFWPWSDYAPDDEQRYQQWLERSQTRERIEQMALATSHPDELVTLERAMDILNDLRAARDMEPGPH